MRLDGYPSAELEMSVTGYVRGKAAGDDAPMRAIERVVLTPTHAYSQAILGDDGGTLRAMRDRFFASFHIFTAEEVAATRCKRADEAIAA